MGCGGLESLARRGHLTRYDDENRAIAMLPHLRAVCDADVVQLQPPLARSARARLQTILEQLSTAA